MNWPVSESLKSQNNNWMNGVYQLLLPTTIMEVANKTTIMAVIRADTTTTRADTDNQINMIMATAMGLTTTDHMITTQETTNMVETTTEAGGD